ncbi:MAG TPA: response regulator [Anaerolineales bacterium]|nr:response regulator [Anaerolineales bacterium]
MAKIMIVDDEVEATNLYKEVLALEGHEAITENSSMNAMRVARETKPDLFILDLMMPPPDGFKLCRMLRQDPEFKHTPIIIVTALDDTDSRIVAFGAGANAYLTKPFRINELSAQIKRLLR